MSHPTTATTTADAIVVGAGIVGASVALELCRRGRRVVVCDRADAPGAGTTAHSSAVVRTLYATPTGIALALEGRRTWEAWAEHTGIAADDDDLARFVAAGVLFLYPEEPAGAGAAEASSRARVVRALGGDAVALDRAALAERFAHLDLGGIACGLFEPGSGYVDRPAAAARNAIAAARATSRLDLRLGADAAVVAVERAGDAPDAAVTGARLAGGERIAAPVVVNAAGGWSAAFGALAGVRLPIETRPARVQYALARAPHGAPDGPVVADIALGSYHKQEGGAPAGVLRTGSILPEDERRFADADAFDPALDADFAERLRGRLAARFPDAGAPADGGGASLYDMCLLDGYPIVDRTDAPGFFVAIGTSGAWFKGAPVLGHLLAELIVAVGDGHDHDRVPLQVRLPRTGHVFDLGRLARGRGRLVGTRELSVLS